MSDRDPHPDSMPQDNTDRRSDIERAVSGRNDDVENVEGGTGGGTSPTVPTVSPDSAGGSGGVVRNQDADAQ
ncbi:hypothetical protein OKW76_04150 [Sphingomonas sp. S1-29]|uniref:hypothetical protein n=1 Tax=Sphingomonas sp. S1-29 TaxID=2991074 RepID=UPI00223FC438|nr:hypothetical protein [Sphingomonas sp. S1-29]UZK70248.1 hypothetical protein OKW76_04150 [Sphingomonas sp. S1-29]